MRFNRSSWLGLLLAMAIGRSALIAAEETKPAASGLAAAREELQQLTADDKLKTNRGKLDLPQLGGISPADEPIPYVSPRIREQSIEEQKKAGRDPNWLVNAVMKDPRNDDRTSAEKEAETVEVDKHLDPMEKLIAEQLRGPREPEVSSAQKADTNAKLEAAVVNPLNAFMEGWVSERDRDLLLGDLKTSSGELGQAQFTNPDSLADSRLRQDMPINMVTGPAGGAFGELFRPEQNPYLNSSIPGAVALPAAAPQYFDALQRQIAPTTQKPGVMDSIATPNPRKTELAPQGLSKSEEDARYFPQLKRF